MTRRTARGDLLISFPPYVTMQRRLVAGFAFTQMQAHPIASHVHR